MQKPGIPAQQMQRTDTRERACGSGTGQIPLAEHAHTTPQPRSIAWGGGGEAAMKRGAPCFLRESFWTRSSNGELRCRYFLLVRSLGVSLGVALEDPNRARQTPPAQRSTPTCLPNSSRKKIRPLLWAAPHRPRCGGRPTASVGGGWTKWTLLGNPPRRQKTAFLASTSLMSTLATDAERMDAANEHTVDKHATNATTKDLPNAAEPTDSAPSSASKARKPKAAKSRQDIAGSASTAMVHIGNGEQTPMGTSAITGKAQPRQQGQPCKTRIGGVVYWSWGEVGLYRIQ